MTNVSKVEAILNAIRADNNYIMCFETIPKPAHNCTGINIYIDSSLVKELLCLVHVEHQPAQARNKYMVYHNNGREFRVTKDMRASWLKSKSQVRERVVRV